MYGKQTETAIAAVGYLAELWSETGSRRVSAADIADARGLQRPFVAKLLSALSQAGIVSGSPGPGGGYALAKAPSDVRLRDVWAIFERPDASYVTPFPPGPIHERLREVSDAVDRFLDETTFAVFTGQESEVAYNMPRTGRFVAPSNGQSTNGHATNGHSG